MRATGAEESMESAEAVAANAGSIVSDSGATRDDDEEEELDGAEAVAVAAVSGKEASIANKRASRPLSGSTMASDDLRDTLRRRGARSSPAVEKPKEADDEEEEAAAEV